LGVRLLRVAVESVRESVRKTGEDTQREDTAPVEWEGRTVDGLRRNWNWSQCKRN
jgi:hypothetical protein